MRLPTELHVADLPTPSAGGANRRCDCDGYRPDKLEGGSSLQRTYEESLRSSQELFFATPFANAIIVPTVNRAIIPR